MPGVESEGMIEWNVFFSQDGSKFSPSCEFIFRNTIDQRACNASSTLRKFGSLLTSIVSAHFSSRSGRVVRILFFCQCQLETDVGVHVTISSMMHHLTQCPPTFAISRVELFCSETVHGFAHLQRQTLNHRGPMGNIFSVIFFGSY